MSLRGLTLAVLVTLLATFAVRTAATVRPEAFHSPAAAAAAGALHLAATACLVLFFAAVARRLVAERRAGLRTAATAAAVGAVPVAVVDAAELGRVLGAELASGLVATPRLQALLPLVAAVSALVFFVALLRGARRDGPRRLVAPALAGLGGTTVITVVRAILLASFLRADGASWLAERGGAVALVAGPLLVVALAALVAFFIGFYRFLDDGGGAELFSAPV